MMTRRSRRGSGAIMSGLMLTTTIAAGSVAVDIGYQRMVGGQLQAGLDAAAIAATTRLADSPAEARAAATYLASLNSAGGSSITLTASEIEIGTWDATTKTFTPLAAAAESTGTAVRISHSVADIPTFLSTAFGVASLGVSRVAISGTAGSGTASCGVLAATVDVINGNWSADSYDSSKGTYLATKSSYAGVCADGSITASGNAKIYGSLYYGRDAGDHASVSGSVTVTGSVAKLPKEVTLPTASSTYAKTHNNNATIGKTSSGKSPMDGTKFSMNAKETLTLNAGTYYFTDFSLNGQAQLKVNGAVKIYVAGDFHANGGGILNQASAPKNLTVYVDGAHSVEVNGSADFYGSIISPNSEGHINGNADFYGIIVGNKIELNGNGKFHEDLAMVDAYVGSVGGNERAVLFQ